MKKKLPKPVVPQDLVERMRARAKEPLPKLSGAEASAYMDALHAVKTQPAMDALEKLGPQPSVEAVNSWLIRWWDSYQCTQIFSQVLRYRLGTADLFKVGGDVWISADNAYALRWLVSKLRRSKSLAREHFMDKAERKAWAKLPERVTIYRGCYGINRKGASFSLDRKIAERFPKLTRYQGKGNPLLITATAKRDDVLLKLGRKEREVIALHYTVEQVKELPDGAA